MSKKRQRYREANEPMPELEPGSREYLTKISGHLASQERALEADVIDTLNELTKTRALRDQVRALIRETP